MHHNSGDGESKAYTKKMTAPMAKTGRVRDLRQPS